MAQYRKAEGFSYAWNGGTIKPQRAMISADLSSGDAFLDSQQTDDPKFASANGRCEF